MVRTLLERIEEGTIPLSGEMEYIQNYLELEKERFKGLNYSIEVDENIPIHCLPIPPLLLYPLTESVIWNYLSSNDYSLKKIRILITKLNNKVNIRIHSDISYNIQVLKTTENNGIKLAKERIDLFNKQNEEYQIQLFLPEDRDHNENESNNSSLTLVYDSKKSNILKE